MRARGVNILCVAVLMPCVLIGCDNTFQEPGRYYDRSKGFSIKFPDGWEKIKSPMIGVNIRFGDPESTAEVGVQIQKISPQKTLADLIAYMESTFQASNIEIVDRGETVIDETDAYWFLFRSGDEKGITYYIIKGDRIYGILCSAMENDFSDDGEYTMREAAESFQFE